MRAPRRTQSVRLSRGGGSMTRLVLVSAVFAGCGSPIYAPCGAAEDCAVPSSVDAECLTAGNQGFCTWSCEVDADCAWDEDAYARVCSSFASEPGLPCFPSCEDDPQGEPVACPEGYTCKSTGGGDENRKVCFPG